MERSRAEGWGERATGLNNSTKSQRCHGVRGEDIWQEDQYLGFSLNCHSWLSRKLIRNGQTISQSESSMRKSLENFNVCEWLRRLLLKLQSHLKSVWKWLVRERWGEVRWEVRMGGRRGRPGLAGTQLLGDDLLLTTVNQFPPGPPSLQPQPPCHYWSYLTPGPGRTETSPAAESSV